jgi:O-acetyl-ADP-ribose deacetylase (regulator of RNase III)
MTPPLVRVLRGDITQQAVDAVVNAASPQMRGGGGVDGAIHRAAGPGLLRENIERFPHGLPVGGAGWTTAHELPASWVIHTVGPVYGRGSRSQLVDAYANSLRVADELGAETVAFPLVSAGVYGWPRVDAIHAGFDGIAASGTSVREVIFVTPTEEATQEVEAALWRVTPLRILQSVRVLHERGIENARLRAGMSPSGMYWRGTVWLGDNEVVGYTTGNGSHVSGMDVTAATTPDALADHLLALHPDLTPERDPAYTQWYRELLDLVEERYALPIAFADYFDATDGWEVGWGSGVRHPHPPE